MCTQPVSSFCFFFFNDTATTEIYTLSLHDALPISWNPAVVAKQIATIDHISNGRIAINVVRSEEHTSELQSPDHLVCRLLLEKKKITHHSAPANSTLIL